MVGAWFCVRACQVLWGAPHMLNPPDQGVSTFCCTFHRLALGRIVLVGVVAEEDDGLADDHGPRLERLVPPRQSGY